MNSEVLNSWKEVAAYLGRGVRTVQRWEQELGLPVRRPRGKDRSAVIALKTDLDRWLHRAPDHETERKAEFKRRFKIMSERVALLRERTRVLAAQSVLLRTRVDNAIRLASQFAPAEGKVIHVSRTEFISDAVGERTNGKLHPDLTDAPLTRESTIRD